MACVHLVLIHLKRKSIKIGRVLGEFSAHPLPIGAKCRITWTYIGRRHQPFPALEQFGIAPCHASLRRLQPPIPAHRERVERMEQMTSKEVPSVSLPTDTDIRLLIGESARGDLQRLDETHRKGAAFIRSFNPYPVRSLGKPAHCFRRFVGPPCHHRIGIPVQKRPRLWIRTVKPDEHPSVTGILKRERSVREGFTENLGDEVVQPASRCTVFPDTLGDDRISVRQFNGPVGARHQLDRQLMRTFGHRAERRSIHLRHNVTAVGLHSRHHKRHTPRRGVHLVQERIRRDDSRNRDGRNQRYGGKNGNQ